MIKKIAVLNSKGQRLSGILHPTPSKELFIICHGFDSSKNGSVIRWMAEGLAEKGYSAFRFDFTGQGESEGDKQESYIQRVEDIHAVIGYFTDKYPAISLVGGSLGGLAAATAAMQGAHINRLILFNPFIYLNEHIVWRMRKVLLLLKMIAPFSKKASDQFRYYQREMKPAKVTVPTLIISGTNDEIVSPRHSRRFYEEIIAEKKMVENGDIDHALTKKPYADFAVNAIVSWIQ